jgi:hypothetical protein
VTLRLVSVSGTTLLALRRQDKTTRLTGFLLIPRLCIGFVFCSCHCRPSARTTRSGASACSPIPTALRPESPRPCSVLTTRCPLSQRGRPNPVSLTDWRRHWLAWARQRESLRALHPRSQRPGQVAKRERLVRMALVLNHGGTVISAVTARLVKSTDLAGYRTRWHGVVSPLSQEGDRGLAKSQMSGDFLLLFPDGTEGLLALGRRRLAARRSATHQLPASTYAVDVVCARREHESTSVQPLEAAS